MNVLFRNRGWGLCLSLVAFCLGAGGARAGLPETRWIWEDGASQGQHFGVYGQVGVSAPTNQPGGRKGAATWKDGQGNLWLFGGLGIAGSGYPGPLADLWKYDIATGEWTWVKGPSVAFALGSYGAKGQSHPGNQPGARHRAVCWTDAQGRFWLFGGRGYASAGDEAGLNDLWMFDPASGHWTWVHGTNQRNGTGQYGTLRQPNALNIPPNRAGAVGWADAFGNLWLFGGELQPVSGTGRPLMNDLWKYDIAKKDWTWMGGTKLLDQPGIYGTPLIPAAANQPGARHLAHAWADVQGRFWLFGGFGRTDATGTGSTNDLWRFDPQVGPAGTWTWMKGGKLFGVPGTLGNLVEPHPSNTPGGLIEGATWTDARGDFWLYGGSGFSTGGDYGARAALWRYQVTSNIWTWMNGTTQVDLAPVFGTRGSHSPSNANTPGGRVAPIAWAGASNHAWLFGGSDIGQLAYSEALWHLAERFGISVSGPAGVLSDTGGAGFGVTEINTPVQQTFTIVNSGLTALSGLNVAIQPVHSGTFALVTPPAATLAPGESTTFTVRFSPTEAAIARATITIDDHDELPPFRIEANGTGILPSVTMALTPDWVWEDAGTPFVFTFTRTGTTVDPLLVSFSVSGEATFGVDFAVAGAETFTATVGTVIIPAGAASASVQIAPAADVMPEGEEIVRLNLEDGAYSATFPGLGEGVIASEELVPGGRDRTFYPTITGGFFSPSIFAVAAQTDGKILIGGIFDTVNGEPRVNLARLQPDGSLDATFEAALTNLPTLQGIAVQPDGRIVIVGCATGTARLLANGSADPTFTALPNSVPINALAIQPDGKILIGGFFTTIHGSARTNLARLQADGTLDTTFDPGAGANAYVECLALQPDGKILVGGQFTEFGGQARSGIVRLQADGSVDSTFDPGTGAAGGTPTYVASLGLQPDGRIVVAGDFSSFNGHPCSMIVRLLPDGSVDPDFDSSGGANYGIETLALQADGKIIVGGFFDSLGGQPVPSLGRLNSDGTFDRSFEAGPAVSAATFGITLLADGRVMAAGQPSIADETHSAIARRANDPATTTLNPTSASALQWRRGGAAPELGHATFDLSTDGGANWIALGAGERAAGGWRLDTAPLPLTGHLRARGAATGAFRGSSSSLHEHIAAFTRAGEVVVEGPGANIIAGAGGPGPWGLPMLTDGTGTVDFGLRQHPSHPTFAPGNSLTFIVHNVGNDDLTGFQIVRDGDHPADFFYGQLNSPNATIIAPGAFKAVTINFSPSAPATRHANLHILSSDADEPSFDIALTGFGASRREMWRRTHFGTIAGTGAAADTADPDGDGSDNNLEFYSGLNPTDPSSRYVLRIELVEGEPTQRKIFFTGPTFTWNGSAMVASDIVIQYRTSLTQGDWEPLEATVNWSFPEWWAIDTEADERAKFYRIQIAEPQSE